MNDGFGLAAVFGALFLIIVVPGYRLKQIGKPYPGLLFNIHKLLAVGTAIFLGVRIRQAAQGLALNGIDISLMVLSVVLALGMVVTGALSSLEKPAPTAVKIIHKWFPYMVLISILAILYRLFL